MGSACPSCEPDYDPYDDQPSLCARHIKEQHPDDDCPTCEVKFKDHKLVDNPHSRSYRTKFECGFR